MNPIKPNRSTRPEPTSGDSHVPGKIEHPWEVENQGENRVGPGDVKPDPDEAAKKRARNKEMPKRYLMR